MNFDDVKVEVVADTTAFDQSMQSLTDATRDFGRVFTSTFASAVRSGRGFDDFLRSLGQRLSSLALSRALKPLENLFDSLIGTVLNSVTGSLGSGGPASIGGGAITPFAKGGVVPFARGGVVSSPTLFNFGEQLGLMGEAGPEAILPLSRGADGRLGVATGGAASSPVNVVFNVQANDVASFRKSEGQLASMLARVVGRGQRGL